MTQFLITRDDGDVLIQVPPYNPLEWGRVGQPGPGISFRTREEAETAIRTLGLRSCTAVEFDLYGKRVVATAN